MSAGAEERAGGRGRAARVDQGDLSDDQIEELGQALMHLEGAMAELQDRYDLTPSDLNIDLGPLGTLLAEEPLRR